MESCIFYGYLNVDKKKLFEYIEKNLTDYEKEDMNNISDNSTDYIKQRFYSINCVDDVVLRTRTYKENISVEQYHIVYGDHHIIKDVDTQQFTLPKADDEQTDKIKKLKKYLKLKSPTINIVKSD